MTCHQKCSLKSCFKISSSQPRVCHTDWSKSERENKISYINTYMWVEVLYIYLLFSRKTMKSCPSGTTGFKGRRGQPVGNMGSLPPLPPQRLGLHAARGGARWTQSNSWGHSCDWAKTYWRREKKGEYCGSVDRIKHLYLTTIMAKDILI